MPLKRLMEIDFGGYEPKEKPVPRLVSAASKKPKEKDLFAKLLGRAMEGWTRKELGEDG